MMSRRIKVITSLMLLTIITILTPQTWESPLNSYKKKSPGNIAASGTHT